MFVDYCYLKQLTERFHGLRGVPKHPIHVVTAWLGNTPAVALRHYLLTTDLDFDRAIGRYQERVIPGQANAESEKAVQNAVQYRTESTRSYSQTKNENRGFSERSEKAQRGARVRNWDTRIRS